MPINMPYVASNMAYKAAPAGANMTPPLAKSVTVRVSPLPEVVPVALAVAPGEALAVTLMVALADAEPRHRSSSTGARVCGIRVK